MQMDAKMTADAFLDAFDPPIPQDAVLRMEVNIHLAERGEEATLDIALRVGMERMYVVRSLPAFLRALSIGERIPFGKGFVLDPQTMRFDGVDTKIIDVLREMETARRLSGGTEGHASAVGKFMPLGEVTAMRVLYLLMARPYRLVDGKEIIACDPIAREPLPIVCQLCEEGRALTLTVKMPPDLRQVTTDAAFVFSQGQLRQVPPLQRRIVRALLPKLENGEASFEFGAKETERVVSEILPQLERAAQVTLSDSLAARIRREPLAARAYVDREGSRVTVRVQFQYGDRVIDPFARAPEPVPSGMLLCRNATAEFSVLETLAHAGFRVGEGQIYLSDTRRVLRFIQEGVQSLQRVAEVFASDDFRHMRPRRPQLSGRLGMNGGALQLTLFDDDRPIEELAGIMQALRDKRKYFRLKDGAFLELSGMDQWEELAEMLGDAAETEPEDGGVAQATAMEEMPVMTLKAYRSAYLVGLLAQTKLPVEVEGEVQAAADALVSGGDPCPEALAKVLRPYQQRGFEWMQALYRLRMGGVLADDMGLGKTLQVIATMLWAKEKDGVQPSLVVAPTSLVYNWQAELTRFSPELSVHVMEGNQRARLMQWAELKKDADTDVIITSYPLLRRDIALIGEMPFRFVVLDEAQHIKNPQSLAAASAGRMNGRTRLALTGTPMENNPGELWSIFHFVLPGYLAPLPQFMRRHGDGSGADVLRRRIRPFLLRRLKRDVLPELPDKIESRVLAEMPDEQRDVYAAAALSLRERVERVLEGKGLGRGRMEVLSAITQLRQICCHPSLVMDGYQGSSGKLDALMEMLPDALAAGQRALLFSQFTSMLAVLKARLNAEGIGTLYLDGKTPAGQRMELVNRFNDGEGQVFLISLKAGGAGLNLTGADTVIHYDPWWNPAAEDQATDRAHRIGQKRVVQVMRLITRGTIEEQVARLSERKRALFDAVVTAGEQMPSDLTEAEIMGLFG